MSHVHVVAIRANYIYVDIAIDIRIGYRQHSKEQIMTQSVLRSNASVPSSNSHLRTRRFMH